MEFWEGDITKVHGKTKYNNINVWFYKPYLALFETLLGQRASLDEYWEAFETLTFSKEDRIKNREFLVEEFEYHKSKNDQFFVESAPKAVLNPGGYWNLHGGHHRTGYLLAKGETFLPIKVRVPDYEKWCNKLANNELKEKIYYLSKGKLKSKINHPLLVDYVGERENTTNRIFRDVFSCLNVCEGIQEDYLDLSDMDGFFSRNVVRQRLGKADLAYSARTELVKALDEILFVKGVNYLCDTDAEEKTYDNIFCVNRYQELHNSQNILLQKIISYVKKRVFIEIYHDDFERISRSMRENGFVKKRLIHKEYIDGSMKEIYLYEK